jgi:hypothetical protein
MKRLLATLFCAVMFFIVMAPATVALATTNEVTIVSSLSFETNANMVQTTTGSTAWATMNGPNDIQGVNDMVIANMTSVVRPFQEDVGLNINQAGSNNVSALSGADVSSNQATSMEALTQLNLPTACRTNDFTATSSVASSSSTKLADVSGCQT